MCRLLACITFAAAAAPAWGDAPARPLVPLLDAPQVASRCDEGLRKARSLIAAMDREPGGETLFDEWNGLLIAI